MSTVVYASGWIKDFAAPLASDISDINVGEAPDEVVSFRRFIDLEVFKEPKKAFNEDLKNRFLKFLNINYV